MFQHTLVALIHVVAVIPCFGEGIPEPGLTMYGVVRNVRSNACYRLTFGTLAWTIRPPSGSPIVVTVPLTNINDQFSYVLTVPFESEINSFTVSPGALKLMPTPTTYNRATVTVNGVLATNRPPSLQTFVFSGAERGRIERVDLDVSMGFVDSDRDGLPDDWEIAYFGNLRYGANDDPDGDRITNGMELAQGTNPNDPSSFFALIQVQAAPTGGVLVRWASTVGEVYEIERATNLTTSWPHGFVTLPTGGIQAVNSITEFTDTTATGPGPYFYRLRIKN